MGRFGKNVSYPNLGLCGRLGNSLYELASTAGIANKMGVEPRFNAGWIHRPYFNVPDEYFTDDFSDCTEAWKTPLVSHIKDPAKAYLQDINLFSDILPTIREWLQPSELARKIMDESPEVAEFKYLPEPILSVHVRRGDNAPGGDPLTPGKYRYHPMPTNTYYQTAIDMLEPYVASVAVFGDDPEWNKKNIAADFYSEGIPRPKEHEKNFLTAPILDWIDFQMMAQHCDYHVLSNSTFGIMAALLADTERATVSWPIFGPALNYINQDLMILPEWTKLPNGRS